MNRDDVIRMAREAGIPYDPWPDSAYNKNIERFAALVAAHVRETEFKPDWNKYQQGLADGAAAEREACAKVVEASPSYDWHRFAGEAAAAIRARGQA
jgi:hypothetical protein